MRFPQPLIPTRFLERRQDAKFSVRPPLIQQALGTVATSGVNLMVLQEKIDPPEITLASILPFDLT